ncbi:retrovirus-related pol polyprotein from transposon TNT 1-94 [Tanacetum coccineum]
MKEEMDSLRKNKTWELVDHPVGQKLVSCKWLFKIKEGIEGVQNPRYKARLVARGFKQGAEVVYMRQHRDMNKVTRFRPQHHESAGGRSPKTKLVIRIHSSHWQGATDAMEV